MQIVTVDEVLRYLVGSRGAAAPPTSEEPRIVPSVTTTNDNLYGVPIFVYGEGFRGQYLRHGYVERRGRRYWVIEYGWTTLYGVLRDGTALPLVVLGMPTRFVFEYRAEDFVDFRIDEQRVGVLECLEEQILNLSRVLERKDPVMIIDLYDVLRSGTSPSEVDRVVELTQQVVALSRALAEYERVAREYRARISILEARNASLESIVRDLEERLVKTAMEVTHLQSELFKLREELAVRGVEVDALEETRRRLMDIIDRARSMLEQYSRSIDEVMRSLERRIEEAVKKLEEKGEKK